MVTTVTNNSPQAINTSLFSLEKDTDGKVLLLNQKIKEANDAIASINKILDGLNKDANVVSVNGKTGIVTLDASDVGALPDSTVIPDAQVNSDWNATSGVTEILNKPNLASVATSGSYNDLSDKPTIPADPVQSNWTETDTSSLAYIKNKPAIPVVPETFGVVLPFIYSEVSQYWFKVGTIPYNSGSSRFPFCMFKLNIMGYYRNDNTGDFLIQCGIYDRNNLTRRLTRCDLVKTGNADCAIAVDDQMNVWIQPFSTYGSAFVLTYIGGRNFTFNVTRGNLATFGTASGFTPLITMTTAGSNTF